MHLIDQKGCQIWGWMTYLFLFCYQPTPAQEITFSKDIAPIIYHKCVSCHQPGQVGPMPLTNYEEVSSYAKMIAYVTEVGYMPPWRAASNHSLIGENKLTDQEKAKIQDWLAGGLPEGDRAETPSLPERKQVPEMTQSDLTLSMAMAFEQYGVYYDQYKVFVLPTHLSEDRFVKAIEFVPGERTIVRGAMISIDTTDAVEPLDKWDPQYGYFSFGELGFVPYESRWYNWHPGKGMTVFPEDRGQHLPKGARLLLHIHYGPTGVPLKDSSQIRLQFHEDPPLQTLHTVPLFHQYNMTNDSFFIPANQLIRYHASWTVPFDLDIHGIFPHSNLLGKKWEIFSVDTTRKASSSLLKIEDWDFNWKQMYDFTQPVRLKKGPQLHALTTYDNTSENPLNPSDPPKDMAWGKRMFEELFLVYFKITPVQQMSASQRTIQYLTGPTNIVTDAVTFQFQLSEEGQISAMITDFDGNIKKEIGNCKHFVKGVHALQVDWNDMPKGNYYLELSRGEEKLRKLLVLMERTAFD